jgi:hypothetical protein
MKNLVANFVNERARKVPRINETAKRNSRESVTLALTSKSGCHAGKRIMATKCKMRVRDKEIIPWGVIDPSGIPP